MLWAASLATGLLLAGAWPARGFTPLIFLALVPLLWAEDYAHRHRKEKERPRFFVFGYAALAFFVWNILTTYWIWNSTPAGAMAWVINTVLMATVFYLYHFTSRNISSNGARGAILIVFWVAFECLHTKWDISWPWLTLGNAFSPQPRWIQWYEYTGAFGGSIWILAANMLFLEWLKSSFLEVPKRQRIVKALAVCLLILVPIGASMWRYEHYERSGKNVETVVVQPNINPYEEQYSILPVEAVKRMLFLSEYAISENTRFIVTPESMIQEYVWEHSLSFSPSVNYIRSYLANYPNIDLIAGVSTYSVVAPKDTNISGVRKRYGFRGEPTLYYRAHNTAMIINSESKQPYLLRHKSKLTPGVEIMPFVEKVKFLEKLAINLGGIVGTLGVDSEPKVFTSVRGKDTIRYGDVICYESITGDFVAGFTRRGAELLFISTNDGWWGRTPGHRQHVSYARLRAIENRRDIARSANTGTSCFITQRGDVIDATPYWQPAVIKQTLKANQKLTFYVRYGDIIGRTFMPISLLLLLGGVILNTIKKEKKHEI